MRHVGIILLAAGESRRLGTPKQLIPFRGKTLLAHTVDTALASQCQPVIIVLGANAHLLKNEIPTSVIAIENPRWPEGMSSSIHAGLNALDSKTDAVILMLCDQPLITTDLLNQFTTHARAAIVAAEYNGTVGVPALFPRDVFPELLALRGPQGAKQVLIRHIDNVIKIHCAEAAIDIDTAADLERLRACE